MYVDQTASGIPAVKSDNETNDPLVQDVHHSSHDDNLLNYHTQVYVQSNSTTLHTMERSQQKESIYKLQNKYVVSTTEWFT